MIAFIPSLLIKLALIIVVLFLPFVSEMGSAEFGFASYYVKTNIALLISVILIFSLIMYYIFKAFFSFMVRKKLRDSKAVELALLASVTNDRVLISQYSGNIRGDSDSILYIKCKNFLNFDKVESAVELIKCCNNSMVKQSIMYEVLFYYYSLNDLENTGKIIKSINTEFQDSCWSFKMQIDFFYKIGELEKVIGILKHPRMKNLDLDYKPQELIAYCYIRVASAHIRDNRVIEAKQVLKVISLLPNSHLNISFSEMLISVGDNLRACSILANLYKTSASLDLVNLYKLAGGQVSELFSGNNNIMADYFTALDKYASGAFRDSLIYLASNSNNYLVYKLKYMVLLKLDLLDEAKKYMEKLLTSKKAWYWECQSCKYISEKYCYECSNCKKLGIAKTIDD